VYSQRSQHSKAVPLMKPWLIFESTSPPLGYRLPAAYDWFHQNKTARIPKGRWAGVVPPYFRPRKLAAARQRR